MQACCCAYTSRWGGLLCGGAWCRDNDDVFPVVNPQGVQSLPVATYVLMGRTLMAVQSLTLVDCGVLV